MIEKQQNEKEDKLTRARKYEQEKEEPQNAENRPAFHVTPPVGWMNDPNGFSLYQGEYHLFYQYHPYSTQWGPMHWGHCKTKDFVKWEQLPCALAPDTDYDGQGCFSGSAVEHEGKHILMYTSVRELGTEDGARVIRQTQSIAVGDGLNYTKIQQNPVITADVLPEGSSSIDFRDPRIWKEGNTFYSCIGSRNADDSGQIALFSSGDTETWKWEGIIDRCNNRYGKMWECPDFFTLEEKQVLIVSPQFMRAEGLEFHNGNNSIYFAGTFDREAKQFLRDEAGSIDYGLDFYAPQTVETADGRRVMIAWMQSWDNYLTPEDFAWSGVMTIPRELSFKGNKLIQKPIRELEAYWKKEIVHKAVKLEKQAGEKMLDGIHGRIFDMTVECTGSDYRSFEIILAADSENRTSLIYDREKGTLTTDRTYSGLVHDLISTRSMVTEEHDGKISLRILMDKFTLEVFANDGEQAMTSLIYTPLCARDIRFSCDGTAEISVVMHELV